MTDSELMEYLAECRARMKTLTDALLAYGVKPGDEFVNTDGAPMFVAEVYYDVDGYATAVWLTADGRPAHTGAWHTGDAHEWIRVERYSERGMEFHGFVDSESRLLLQTG